jgi:hypothetical protein
MLKIGVDFHGVLEECKDSRTVKLLLEDVRRHYFVYIVSGPPIEKLMVELLEAGYEIGEHFDAAISTVDFMKSKDIKMWRDGVGDWWTDEDTWNASKGMVCEDYDIDILIDDMDCYRNEVEKHCEFYLYHDMERFIYLIAKLIDGKTSDSCK